MLAMLLVACGAKESTAQRQATAPGAERRDTALAPQFALHPTLGGKLQAPQGLEVDYFARNLSGVRFMVVGPDGAVYASRPAGEIVRLADTNGDGVADDVAPVITGLQRPHGMAFFRGAFYVAEGSQLTRFAVGANGRPGGSGTRVTTYSGGGGHWTRTVIVGPDSLLYVSVGSSCNICERDTPERASVLQVDPVSGQTRPYSIGLRNAVGLAVNQATREIWVTTHERDNLGDDVPPEEIDILKDGGDFGWPYCWGNRQPNPEYKDAGRCASTIPPALMMQAHSAPLGITFLRGATQLRSEYQGDALVAFHGSWNRSVPTGAKVVRVRIANGKPTSYEDFVTGWQDASGSRWGRPVDVLVNRDGSVLISDDSGNAIYRVHR
ncbi:MAG TPA: PQQ-dependent sugar dehydrogenase [Gemmatimonadaceae bacterium]|nr:PQQ-dependent sugar dehydrogenase [Gemmatimonadaceae bacterium]